MFSRQESKLVVASPNSVYQSPIEILSVYTNEAIRHFRYNSETWQIHSALVEFKQLSRLHRTLRHLLLNQPIDESLIRSLSQLESKCLSSFIFKKNMTRHRNQPITSELVRRIQANPQSKRPEEMLKFILKKTMKNLKDAFSINTYHRVHQGLRPEYSELGPQSKLEYAFYGFYFGQVAHQLGLPIETFFLSDNRRKCIPGKRKFLLKSISQFYINYLKMSKSFVRDAKRYLRHLLIVQMKRVISHKIQVVCCKWEEKCSELGERRFLNWLEKDYVDNPKCKQPWSVQQVQMAVDFIFREFET